jgi:hypothetical protein
VVKGPINTVHGELKFQRKGARELMLGLKTLDQPFVREANKSGESSKKSSLVEYLSLM